MGKKSFSPLSPHSPIFLIPLISPLPMSHSTTVLFVEDSAEDRALYQRLLEQDDRYIYEAGLSECHIQLLEQFQVQANLVVPIVLKSQGTSGLELWGLFIVHQCSTPRQWQTFEVELLKQLTVQLAIAIQQALLYQNLQTLNTQLEAKVQERTAALQESDRRQYGNTGLGLSLVKKLVQYLQGTIEVNSSQGWTNFIIKLPLLLSEQSVSTKS